MKETHVIPGDKLLLTYKSAGALIDVSSRTMMRMCKREAVASKRENRPNRLPVLHPSKGQSRIRRSDLEKYVEALS